MIIIVNVNILFIWEFVSVYVIIGKLMGDVLKVCLW